MSIFAGRTYHAEGNQVWASAVETKGADGSTRISLGFGILQVNDSVQKPDRIASEIADLLNAAAATNSIVSAEAGETEESFFKATLRAANAARQQEWDTGGQITLAYRGNELAGEVGEACNVIKKLERERLGIRGSRDTKEHLAEELADIVICADLIAMDAGIDLEAAVAAKFNATSEKVGLKTRYVRKGEMV